MSRRTLLVTGTAAVVVLLGAAATVASNEVGEAEVRAVFRTPEEAERPFATATTGGEAAQAAPAPATPAIPGAPAPHGDGRAVRFDFEAGFPESDATGRLALVPRTAAGGQLTTTPHGAGLAVRFPARCAQYGAESCQRAILQSGPADFLNPGRQAFRYGAAIHLARAETSRGANVVQKGFANSDSQFKLQVDGAAGRPSCVVVGVSSPHIYVAEAATSVADDRWHTVECSRRDDALTITVDGAIRAATTIPAALSIVNSSPLCVGGKGTSANNDQFTGALDDVFVSVGS